LPSWRARDRLALVGEFTTGGGQRGRHARILSRSASGRAALTCHVRNVASTGATLPNVCRRATSCERRLEESEGFEAHSPTAFPRLSRMLAYSFSDGIHLSYVASICVTLVPAIFATREAGMPSVSAQVMKLCLQS
jgi:hypothetical protein